MNSGHSIGDRSRRRAAKLLRAIWVVLLVLLPAATVAQPARTNPVAEKPAALSTNHLPGYAGSASCRDCHEQFYTLWSTSFHGLAMQPYTAELAKTRLTPQTNDIIAGQYRFRADLQTGVVVERTSTNETRYPIVQTTGGKNVFYFLTLLERGWLQVLPVAYDVRRQEWFDTTASAVRHFGDRRDEALYWKERPLTFNTACFSCHVSQLSKNYDLKSDSYHTAWAEPGINCETCHGPSAEHARLFRALPTNQPAPADIKIIVTKKLSIEQRNAMCAPCHAKMSPVTVNFAPGERYFDHFDLVAFENADFHPDGRDLGENYTYTQWRLSPCAKSGKLDCLHCHTSSGRYRFTDAAKANDACLPCHEQRVKDAPAHTHHEAGTPGNQCVSCHMPMTEFARMRRSDHSMRPPTPATTLEYKSPNACNICHTNQDAAWADKFVRQWRQRDYQKPVLERAALIAAARKGDWTRLPDILAYLSRPDREEIQTVSLVRLLANCPADDKWPVLRKLTDDASPLVRAGAVEALGERPDQPNANALLTAVGDDYRLVRVRAAAALAAIPEDRLPEEPRRRVRDAMAELMTSMKSRPDDMSSHYNLGNLHMARGQMLEAVTEFETATRLQPDALPLYVNAALAFNALGQNEKAEASLRRALSLDATNAAANLNLGMLLAEMGKLSGAEQAFRAAFQANPQSAQAAYNLGVLLSKAHSEEALDWCRRAAALGPDNPQYGYTYAFYLHQAGRSDLALQAIRSVRKRHPAHEDSAIFEQALLREQKSAEQKPPFKN
ncbi:MAG: tetratricopeptide repeat protein [Verrucomicrobia bacterium]|jgi:tetratricopeptide (TPR) repeat protein|nr:tetratricopeptide repeat protein [Verrucomicrobiota bacterium]